jgi:ABC-type hemin transport system substrate-binding protein
MIDTPAVKSGRVHRVDGSLITWHGTRLGMALDALQPLFA